MNIEYVENKNFDRIYEGWLKYCKSTIFNVSQQKSLHLPNMISRRTYSTSEIKFYSYIRGLVKISQIHNFQHISTKLRTT